MSFFFGELSINTIRIFVSIQARFWAGFSSKWAQKRQLQWTTAWPWLHGGIQGRLQLELTRAEKYPVTAPIKLRVTSWEHHQARPSKRRVGTAARWLDRRRRHVLAARFDAISDCFRRLLTPFLGGGETARCRGASRCPYRPVRWPGWPGQVVNNDKLGVLSG